MATNKDIDRARLDLRKRLAERLRVERHRLGLTQEGAAEAADMTLVHYQRIEWSKVSVPLDTLSRLAIVMGVDPSDLLVPVAAADVVPHRLRVDHK